MTVFLVAVNRAWQCKERVYERNKIDGVPEVYQRACTLYLPTRKTFRKK